MESYDVLHEIMKMSLLLPHLIHFVGVFLRLLHEGVGLLHRLLRLLDAFDLKLDGFAELIIQLDLLFFIFLEEEGDLLGVGVGLVPEYFVQDPLGFSLH